MMRTTTIAYGDRNLPTSITAPDGTATTIVRDERGNPKSITDASGVTTTFEFNAYGQVTKVTDPRSGTVTYTYETSEGLEKGYLKSVANAGGTTTYAVDHRGNVLAETKAGGNSVSFTVNKLDQLEAEETAFSQSIMSYDGAGALASRLVLAGIDAEETPVFSTSTFAIDELGRARTRTEDGRVTSYGYDPAGNLTSITAPGTAPTTYGYDSRDQLVTITQGTRTTLLAYDPNGVQTSSTNARGKITTYAYDGFGNRVGETAPLGVSIVRSVDLSGRPLDVRIVKRVSDTESYILRWTQFAYDGAGRLTRQTKKRFPEPLRIPPAGDPTGATDVVEQTIYDDAARTMTRIDPRGNATVTQFDEAGRVASVTDAAGNVRETTYDENGNLRDEKITAKRADGTTETFTTRKVYDRANRLVMLMNMNDPHLGAMTFKYDARGNRNEATDAAGRTTKFEYDLRGNMVEQTDPEGGITEYRHDDADRVTWTKDANGNETTYRYYDDGNLLAETRADGATWSYTYDENNNRRTATDPNGTTVTNTYDDADRLTAREIAKGASVLGPSRVAVTYDELGRTVASETAEGVKTTAAYDSVDQLMSETMQVGSGPARTVTNTYDLAGNVATQSYPSGLVVTQTHGPLNRLGAITVASAPLVRYEDAGTRLVARTLANGVHETRSYDASGRLQRIEDHLDAELVRDLRYARSPSGEKSSATHANLARRWSYDRNRNGWITGELLEQTDTETNPMLLSTAYDIDNALNFRRVARIVQTPETAQTTTIEPGRNERNQYTTFGDIALTYDRNGNLERYRGAQLQYDYANRLKKATIADGTTIENTYDAFGRKVQSTVVPRIGTPRTTVYVVAGERVLEEYNDGSLAMRYVRGRDIDEVVRAERSSGFDGRLDQVFYPLQDELGNVDRLTDASGATLERYEYAGYGEFRIFTPSSVEQGFSAYGWKWLFHGREYDRSLQAYDFRARTLWPELGRFGQEDPDRTPLAEMPNLYQSFRGDFADRTDPTGRFSLDSSVDPVLLRGAITRAKLIYQAYGLGSVYKRINRNANARFLDIGTPPRVLAGIDGGDVMGTPPLGETRIVIHPRLLTLAVTHTAAAGVLVSGLLHEQAHVEAKNVGIVENASGMALWSGKGTSVIPEYENHRGYWTDRVLYDGGLVFYDPSNNELQFVSSYAQTASVAQQIDHIRRAKRRFSHWYGTVSSSPQTGIVYDHRRQTIFEVDPSTGKTRQQEREEEWLKSLGLE